MTKTEELKALKQECKELGLTGYSKKDIPELKEMIKSATATQTVDPQPTQEETIEKEKELLPESTEVVPEDIAKPTNDEGADTETTIQEDDGVSGDGVDDEVPTEPTEEQSLELILTGLAAGDFKVEDLSDYEKELYDKYLASIPRDQVLEPSKLHLQYKMIALVYTGEEEREFKEALNRPFPVLKNGDVVITDIKTGRFLSRKTSPFEMVDPSNIEINIKG